MMNKVAIFSDLHLGLKQDSTVWHNIALNWCDWFVSVLKEKNIKSIIFLGDFFHNRTAISANTLDVTSKFLDKLSNFNIYMILGNHDLYYANEPTISPVNLFDGRDNIRVFTKPEIVEFSNKKALFCGWGYNPYDYSADVLFTHAEINLFKFNKDVFECNNGYKPSSLLKNYNIIYSGHFHMRQEKVWGDKKICYVGNTFSMDFSDEGDTLKGIEIFDFDTFNSEFIQNTVSPLFYRYSLNDLISTDNFKKLNHDISGNIIRLIIDKTIEHKDINTLISLFNSAKPLDFSIEWQNNSSFNGNSEELSIKSFDTEDAIKKYIELLDLENKDEITEYLISLYKEAYTKQST